MPNTDLNAFEAALANFSYITKNLPVAQNSVRDAMTLEAINGRIRALSEFPAISKGTIGDRYRFRAECSRDAELFIFSILWFIEPSWTILPLTNYPDVDVKFSIRKEISPRDLLWVASSIVDGHVLVQTLEKEDRYTGERDYERQLDVHEPVYKPSEDVLKDIKNGAAHHIKGLKHLLSDAIEFSENLREISA